MAFFCELPSSNLVIGPSGVAQRTHYSSVGELGGGAPTIRGPAQSQ